MSLNIYKASAGSGKTFTLTFEYLKQALCSQQNAHVFKNLLAVTFTNKATEEMKSRIINTLHQLTVNSDSVIGLQLQNDLAITSAQLKLRAQNCQTALLHNYSYFAISTIDTFFQRIIHSFVKEAGLRPGFKLELDQNRLLEEAIDQMLTQLGNNKVLYKWIFKHIEQRIESGAYWDIKAILLEKGQLVFGETFRAFDSEFRSQIADSDFMTEYTRQIDLVRTDFDQKMAQIGQNGLLLMQQLEVTPDNFKNKSKGPAGYFTKLCEGKYTPTTRVLSVIADENEWLTSSRSDITNQTIQPYLYLFTAIVKEAVDLYNRLYPHYISAQAVRKYLHLLGLLGEIDANVRKVASDHNIMPISETTFLLSKLIDGSETPFIYERMGANYRTYLIDEFQDTSAAQWQNFKPLLDNSLSQDHFCMLVGDVKQSIYRWRNGDWRILAQQVPLDFQNYTVDQKKLAINWRSTAVVIKFNNMLFARLPQALAPLFENSDQADLLKLAYQDVQQELPPATPHQLGYVRIQSFLNTAEASANQQVLDQLPMQICAIQDRGYRAGDIAILVRRAADGQLISDTLLEFKSKLMDSKYCFDIVSSDTLFLNQAPCVQFCLALLRAVLDPSNQINCALINSYLKKSNALTDPIDESAQQQFGTVLSVEILTFLKSLAQLSLPEIFEHLIQYFNLTSDQADLAYVQELHDEILDFSRRQLSDISAFLNWWDKNGKQKKLTAVNNPNAIRIITIHQSKGLQFPIVLIPFCNWRLFPLPKTMLWVEGTEVPFNLLKHVPINYSDNLLDSAFKTAIEEERSQTLVDNINLMYVAFTRAENELHINLPVPRQKIEDDISQIKNIASLLYIEFKMDTDKALRMGDIRGERLGQVLEFGQAAKGKDFNLTSDYSLQQYQSNPFKKKLLLRSDSATYLPNDMNQAEALKGYTKSMLRILSKIDVLSDLPKALLQLGRQGWLSSSEHVDVQKRLNTAFSLPEIARWFDGSWQVYKDSFILVPDKLKASFGYNSKPNRVMIGAKECIIVNYQFGYQIDHVHQSQVSHYIKLLQSMNYPTVSGYVWYVDLAQVIKVN